MDNLAVKSLNAMLIFEDNKLYLDGELIFTIPDNSDGTSVIRFVGFWDTYEDAFSTIYVGSGTKHYGDLYEIKRDNIVSPFTVKHIVSLNTELMDIFPVSPTDILLVGHSGPDEGICLINTQNFQIVDIISREEYNKRISHSFRYIFPIFRIDEDISTIHLDFYAWRTKDYAYNDSGSTAIIDNPFFNPWVEELYFPFDLWGTIDLTIQLKELGIDINKMIQLAATFQRLR